MKQQEILREWLRAIALLYRAHAESARHYERRTLHLGIPVVALTTITGTTIFATIQQESLNTSVQVSIGVLSVAAAILASLQTFLGYPDRSEKHKSAAVKYGALKREIEQALALCTEAQPCTDEFIGQIRTQWNRLDEESPTLRRRTYAQITEVDTREKVEFSKVE